MICVPFLAAWQGGGSAPWWQILGAFLLVAGLLLLTLRLLGRWQTGGRGGEIAVLSVTGLGPRRAVETVRSGDEVLVLYRSEGAMVLIERRSLAEHEALAAERPASLAERLAERLRGGDADSD